MSGAARILVVDDEPTLRMGFRLALFTEGHRVELASTGEEALRALLDDSFDLMILDLRMPGLDGLGVLRALGELDRQIPVIVASAHMDEAVVREALHLGAIDFLSKPTHLEELRSLARRVLEEERGAWRANTGAPSAAITQARRFLRRRKPSAALETLTTAQARLPADLELNLWRRLATIAAKAEETRALTPGELHCLLSWCQSTS